MSVFILLLIFIAEYGISYGQGWTLNGPIDCVTITGENSGSGDDSKSIATCSAVSGYTLTSCGIWGAWGDIDGAYIENNECIAQMGDDGSSGHYVQAKARCCNLHSSIECRTYDSSKSGTEDDSSTIAECEYNLEQVTGCSAYTNWKEIDGSYPGDNYQDYNDEQVTFIWNQQCKAVNGNGGNGVWANAQCCLYNHDDYKLICGHVIGDLSGSSDDDLSIVECPDYWFMTGCSGYSPWKSVEAWYIDDNDRCLAKNKNGGNGVYAIGTCCREWYYN